MLGIKKALSINIFPCDKVTYRTANCILSKKNNCMTLPFGKFNIWLADHAQHFKAISLLVSWNKFTLWNGSNCKE